MGEAGQGSTGVAGGMPAEGMKMSRLLVTAARAVRRAVEQGQRAVAKRVSRRIVAVYDAIVLRGLAFHEQQPALERRPGARPIRQASRTQSAGPPA